MIVYKRAIILVALFNIFHSHPLLCQGLQKLLDALNQIQVVSNGATDSFLNKQALKRFQIVRVDPRKFEATYRAAKTVMANVTEGVSYRQYVDLVQSLVSEISIQEDMATSEDEKFLSNAYRAAAEIYTTTGRYWSISIQNGKSPGEVIGASWSGAQSVLKEANGAYLRNLKSKQNQNKNSNQTQKH